MDWIVKERYTGMSESDMENNVLVMVELLRPVGWTDNAIAGICGCIQRESHFDPWAWQGNRIQPQSIMQEDNPRGRAYGLVQWDSCNKYLLSPIAQAAPGYGPNFSDKVGSQNDGTAQLVFINTGSGYAPTTNYPEKFSEFKSSEKGADYLAAAWLYNFERPASGGSTEQQVRENGLKWYDFIISHEPDPNRVYVTVNIHPVDSGTVTGDGAYSKGESVILRATPNAGYEFVHWITSRGTITQNPYVFTIQENEQIVAIFSGESTDIVIKVNSAPKNGGKTTGTGTYEEGESVIITAEANIGFEFIGFYENGSLLSAENTITFIAEYSRTIVAKFKGFKTIKNKLKFMTKRRVVIRRF